MAQLDDLLAGLDVRLGDDLLDRIAESEDRDRRYKPGLYADAGIRHLWRIEDEKGLPVVHTYELDDTTRVYVATGVHRDRLLRPLAGLAAEGFVLDGLIGSPVLFGGRCFA